jgi:hypothetical protein
MGKVVFKFINHIFLVYKQIEENSKMWLWLKSLLEIAVGTVVFGLILYAIGLDAILSMLIPFWFGFLFWLAWELHRWEKKHGID